MTEPRTQTGPPARHQSADPSKLEDRVPNWLKAPRLLAGFTGLIGFVYVVLSYRPIWFSDIWGHLAYGRFLWQTGHIPLTEPLMPLAKGMPYIDTAWLSQLIGFGAISAWGPPGIQFLYAASITACVAILLWRTYQSTRNVWISLVGCGLFAWASWWQLLIVRPQLAGLVCFMALFAVLAARRRRAVDWFFIPALFVAWANLHGSFIVGLGLLACFTAGRAADVIRRTRNLKTVLRDRKTWRLLVMTELAAVAVLVNPYGIGLYAEVLSVVGNNNVWDLKDWRPLTLHMRQGQAAFAIALALIVAYRLSPRRVSVAELLMLAGLGGLALWTSRMIVWWAPLAAYWFAVHASAAWKHMRRGQQSAASVRSGLWTAVTVGLVWICFACTPFGGVVLHGHAKSMKDSVAAFTPVGAAEYLNQHPPEGLIFNTFEWGDFLLWAGPTDIQVFVASHAHLIPPEVWRDYLEILKAGAGANDLLDRYGVNGVVIDRANHEALIAKLRRQDQWEVRYEDSLAVVFQRRDAI